MPAMMGVELLESRSSGGRAREEEVVEESKEEEADGFRESESMVGDVFELGVFWDWLDVSSSSVTVEFTSLVDVVVPVDWSPLSPLVLSSFALFTSSDSLESSSSASAAAAAAAALLSSTVCLSMVVVAGGNGSSSNCCCCRGRSG